MNKYRVEVMHNTRLIHTATRGTKEAAIQLAQAMANRSGISVRVLDTRLTDGVIIIPAAK